MQPCLPVMLAWCADFRVDAMNDLWNTPCSLASSTPECIRPLHNCLPNVFTKKKKAWIMFCIWSSCMARPATVPGIRHKKGEKRLTAPCDCESVLEAEGWTLGNPAYSLRNTSSGLVLSFLCHVLPAGLFPLSPLPRSLSFSLPVLPHTRTWVFHVHGCVGMWSMWPLRHSCAWYWCEVQLGVRRGYCLFGQTVNWHYWSEPGHHPSCVNKCL